MAKSAAPPDRTAFLKEMRDRHTQLDAAEKQQRRRENEALKFYAGEQWPEELLEARKGQPGNGKMPPLPARPTITINKVREPVRHVLNEERQADMGIEVVPADDFEGLVGPIDPTEIELREGFLRRIQRQSHAKDARTWAFERAVIAGRGYYGVLTQYVPGKSFDQEIVLQRFYDQSSVGLDPEHEQPDGSDADWAFGGGVNLPLARFKQEYPDAKASAYADADWRLAEEQEPGWFLSDGEQRFVRVVNYYYTTRTTRELVQLETGAVVWEDELVPESKPVVTDRRTVTTPTITWAKVAGHDVLDETEWPGKYIPIVKVMGDEMQPYDKQHRAMGMVEPAIGSNRGFNYMVSKEVETVGLAPIPPWIMAEGQMEGHEAAWQASATRAITALQYRQKDLDGMPAPPPTRTQVDVPIQAIAIAIREFDQAIKTTTGIPDATLGNIDPSLKSGKAIQALLAQAQRGTSNYLDNLARSITYEAQIINDLLPKVYGRPGRLARILNTQGETQAVLLHQPFTLQGPEGQQRPVAVPPGQPAPPEAKTYKLTPDANFNIAIKVTKSYDTRREEEANTIGQLIAAEPQLMGVFGDLYFKYQDGPGHEEMEQRARAVLVPPVQALLSGKDQVPPQAQALIAQGQQAIQALTQELQKAQQIIQTKQVESQAKLQEAQMDNASREKIALINASVGLEKTQATLDAENARTYVDAVENRLSKLLELHMAKLDHVHQMQVEAHSAAHDVALASLQHQHATDQLAQQASQQAAASDQGHQQQLEAQQQAADLQPAPDATGVPA